MTDLRALLDSVLPEEPGYEARQALYPAHDPVVGAGVAVVRLCTKEDCGRVAMDARSYCNRCSKLSAPKRVREVKRHGASAYAHGYCRCDVCCAANTKRWRDAKARKKRGEL